MMKKIKNALRFLARKNANAPSREGVARQWEEDGSPVPPPHIVKQGIIQEFQQKTGYSILIETGTYQGDMVEAQKSRFGRIISIELGQDLFEKARKRFDKDKNVTIAQGDSGKVLPLLLENVDRPAIFWLDGHYSEGITARGEKECPIFEEIEAIFSKKNLNHVLLIDDARLFTGQGDYPSIEELTEFIKSKNPHYEVEVKHDIIRAEAGIVQ